MTSEEVVKAMSVFDTAAFLSRAGTWCCREGWTGLSDGFGGSEGAWRAAWAAR